MIDPQSGLIQKIAPQIEVDRQSVEIIDQFQEMHLFPGFIDPHVHFRYPGFDEAEDWASGSQAALFGGVTTVLEMPNTKPATTDAAAAEVKLKHVREKSLINYGLFGGYNGSNLSELLENPDFKAIKVFLGATTGTGETGDIDALGKIVSNKVITFHAEKESIIQANAKRLGEIVSPQIHSQIRSEEAAIEAVKEVIALNKINPGPYHIAHVSTDTEAKLLLEAGITFEVAPHHLFLSVEDYEEYGFFLKCNPPLRSQKTRGMLFQLLLDGSIDMIATDHAPHLKSQKERTDIVPPSGIPSIAIGSHLILNEVAQKRISPQRASRLLAGAAADKFNIQKRGRIKEGNYADFAVVDLNEKWTFRERDIPNKCGWSPFDGKEFHGRVKAAFVNGAFYEQPAPLDHAAQANTGAKTISAISTIKRKGKVYQV